MNSQHRYIRAMLNSMAPKRAISYIKAFELREEEELFLIECDVRGKSIVKAAMDNSTTPEVVSCRKRSAYSKISDQINHGDGSAI